MEEKPSPYDRFKEAIELEEKILKLLNVKISPDKRENLRIEIANTQKDDETYHSATRRFYYKIIKEKDYNIPRSCVTSRLNDVIERLQEKGRKVGPTPNYNETLKLVIKLEEKKYLIPK